MSGINAVTTYPVNALGEYQFAVTFTQCGGVGGGWLFARRKGSEVWEAGGGRVEPNETLVECAKRGLEDKIASINPAFDFSVSEGNGQVFYAYMPKAMLAKLPEEPEMKVFSTLPEKLAQPQIVSALFDELQNWLGLKDKAEYWDLYDENRQPLGRTHKRGIPVPDGLYHIVVRAWIVNSKGEFLITRRAFNKIGYPGSWESPTGSATAGEDSLTAIMRETKEETGITLFPENAQIFDTRNLSRCFFDSWLFRQEYELADVVLQEGETIDARKATWSEISDLIKRGEFVDAPEFGLLKELV
jgi:8-oxo-dGTP pyrophosphatase MutT (NUDIX family)